MPWIEEITNETKEIHYLCDVGLSYGDYLMLTPSFRLLKNKYPHCKLNFWVELDDEIKILDGNQYLDCIMSFKQFMNSYRNGDNFLLGGNYAVYQIPSIVIDEVFKKENAYKAYCDNLGLYAQLKKEYIPDYYIFESEKEEIENMLREKGIEKEKPIIIIHTEASSPLRNWHPEYTKELALRLSKDYQVILLGIYYKDLANLNGYHNIYSFIDEVSVRLASALLDFADLLVGPDSLFMHVAGALNTQALALMSSFSGNLRYNLMPSVEVFQKEYRCAPCMQHNIDCCEEGKINNLSPDANGNYISMPCMLSISPDEIYNKIIEKMEKIKNGLYS